MMDALSNSAGNREDTGGRQLSSEDAGPLATQLRQWQEWEDQDNQAKRKYILMVSFRDSCKVNNAINNNQNILSLKCVLRRDELVQPQR